MDFSWRDAVLHDFKHFAFCVSVIILGSIPRIALRDIVDIMQKHEEIFAEFAASDTSKLFTPPIFENKKKANGYWF